MSLSIFWGFSKTCGHCDLKEGENNHALSLAIKLNTHDDDLGVLGIFLHATVCVSTS